MMRLHLNHMSIYVRPILAGVVVCMVLSGTPESAISCPADSVLNLFEASLPQDQVTKVKYRKESRSLVFGERPAEEGTLWLGPPKRYRIEAGKQVIVRGDDTLWTYTPESGQVTLRVGGLDSLEFGPAGFFGSLRHDFLPTDCAVDTVDGTPWLRVRLAAKTETAPIQRLALWIDPATHHVHVAEYVDYNEESSRLTFSKFESEKAGGADRFVFVYPRNVERIVLPAVKSGQAHDEGD